MAILTNEMCKYDSDGSQTAISGINAEFIMNLGGFSMTANELEICIGGSNCGNAVQRWVVDTFASIYAGEGVITGGSTSGDIYDSGDSIIDGFTADLNGFITVNGDNERALLLGFDMAADSSNDVVVGASLISASIDQAFIYDSSYRSDFTHFGFAISQDFSGIITGPVNPASSPQLISFEGGGAQLSPQTRFNADPYHILETSTVPGTVANLSSSVDWYKWTSPGNHSLFNNPTTLSSYSEDQLTDELLFTIVTAYTYGVSGSATFSSSVSNSTEYSLYSLADSGYSLNVSGSFDLDFDTADLHNGFLELDFQNGGSSELWQVDFSGSLNTVIENLEEFVTYLEDVSIDGSKVYIDDSLVSASISGDISGILAEGASENLEFAGGFKLTTGAQWAQGLFNWMETIHLTAQEQQSLESADTVAVFVSGSPSNHHFSELYAGPVFSPNGEVENSVFTARQFNSATLNDAFDIGSESILRSSFGVDSVTTDVSTGSHGVDYWGNWSIFSANPGGDPNTEKFARLSFDAASGDSTLDGNGGHDAFWFIADPTSDALPVTGHYDYSSVIDLQGTYSTADTGGAGTPAYAALEQANSSFGFSIDFSTGDIYNGSFSLVAGDIDWQGNFSDQSLSGAFLTINSFTSSGVVDNGDSPSPIVGTENSVTGEILGYFTGAASSTGAEGIALAFNLAVTDSSSVNHSAYGTLLLDGDGVSQEVAFSSPEPSTELHNISWGSWDNPIEDNWVVVAEADSGKVEVQTDDFMAEVTPTPIANLTGAASYASSPASAFIGSGSAGDVTQVVAGMNVDFNTGMISDGSLQVQVAGSQAWEIDFAGTVAAGNVDLHSTGGVLMDPGGLISNDIGASLDGVFTGNNAEAFVGGFDLVDEVNALNHVNGLYTIEK